MTERGLFMDLRRVRQVSEARAIKLGRSWDLDAVFIVEREHRLNHVCSTLEALGYMLRRYQVGELGRTQAAWELTEKGFDLLDELERRYRYEESA